MGIDMSSWINRLVFVSLPISQHWSSLHGREVRVFPHAPVGQTCQLSSLPVCKVLLMMFHSDWSTLGLTAFSYRALPLLNTRGVVVLRLCNLLHSLTGLVSPPGSTATHSLLFPKNYELQGGHVDWTEGVSEAGHCNGWPPSPRHAPTVSEPSCGRWANL